MTRRSIRRGFTLIELSIAIMLGMAIGGMVLAISNQQLKFLQEYRKQSFLTEEAPIISMHVSRIIGKAGFFRLHGSLTDAKNGNSPIFADAKAVALVFRQPSGEARASILSFEERSGVKGLYYYIVPKTGPLGTPQWAITKRAKNVVFAMDQGVLRMTITGPEDEKITYSGTMQQ